MPVNPFDKAAIKQAILTQYNAEHKKVDMTKCDWAVAAKQTYEAYQKVLDIR